jgi:uncharacterized lipoprotein YmbA
MKNGFRLPPTLITVAVVASLAGCSSSPASRFYTLSPLVLHEAKSSPLAVSGQVSVGIAPVEVPDYLDRPQIVTRDGQNGLRLAEFDRWAGSLSDNIGAVLAENLSLLLGTERVFVHPRMSGEKSDFSLALRVLRLECAPGDEVLLKVQWTLLTGGDSTEVATRVATFSERLSDREYRTVASAISHAVGELSRQIALEILAQPKETPSQPPAQATP